MIKIGSSQTRCRNKLIVILDPKKPTQQRVGFFVLIQNYLV
ncbi:hypothetical protein HMPREF9103_02109 [Lentilactobacillus parafarraginis F0439]|uniref:Uncharacterized protein n=1 Tax=Lentilactobacillus parafarraginis F0439 TaxID=797515 RepID=G9ZQV1_9LACO|nr:hypothetical protein HMPREF9103_02109 [Lentilactobacillus parafarraginis F0439]